VTGRSSAQGETPARAVSSPRLIAWEVTRYCLLKCKHCRASAQPQASAGELTTQEFGATIDNIASFARPIIILTGGEPMLRSDIYEIASYAASKALPVVMSPCGMLVSDETVAKIKAAGIRRISISIDGATAKSHDEFRGVAGSFDGCLRGIEAARRGGLDFQINTTISRHNVQELGAILELAIELGASVFNPFLLVPTGRGKELADQELSPQQYERTLHWLADQQARKDIRIRVTCAPHYFRILRQRPKAGGDAAPRSGAPRAGGQGAGQSQPRAAGPQGHSHDMIAGPAPVLPFATGCLGGKSFAFISHRGRVQICGFMDVECGDLRRENYDFRKIWLESKVFNQMRDVDSYHGRCGYCEFRTICGGCRARAYALSGDYQAEEPFCVYRPQRRP